MERNSWYFSEESLRRSSPSRLDGIPEDKEKAYRRKTCFYIDETGHAIGMPKLTVATAHVFFHRFFARQSFKRHDRFLIAAACLLLAGKVEESPKKLKDVVMSSFTVRKRNAAVSLDQTNQEYAEHKEKILMCERILLHTIGFDMCIEHPYKYLIEICKELKKQRIIGNNDGSGRDFAQTALNFVNDSMRTSLCLQFPPAKVAAAAVFLATLFREIRPEKRMGPRWVQLLMVGRAAGSAHPTPQEQATFENDLHAICKQIMELYQSTKSDKHRETFRRMAQELNLHHPHPPAPPVMGSPPGGGSLGGEGEGDRDRGREFGNLLFAPSPSQPSPSPAHSNSTPLEENVQEEQKVDSAPRDEFNHGPPAASNYSPNASRTNGRSRAESPVEKQEAQFKSGESGEQHPSTLSLTREPGGVDPAHREPVAAPPVPPRGSLPLQQTGPIKRSPDDHLNEQVKRTRHL